MFDHSRTTVGKLDFDKLEADLQKQFEAMLAEAPNDAVRAACREAIAKQVAFRARMGARHAATRAETRKFVALQDRAEEAAEKAAQQQEDIIAKAERGSCGGPLVQDGYIQKYTR